MTFDGHKPDSLSNSYGEYGEGLEPTPTKAVIGLVIMIVIGVVLYQTGGTSTDTNTSSATLATSRDVANNAR